MQVKFLKSFYCVNVDKLRAVNDNRSLYESLPEVDGEISFFDGADEYVITNNFVARVPAGQPIKVDFYTYNTDTCTLDFKVHIRYNSNKICTNFVDITTYRINPITWQDFEILED